jgi:hypothetical protein
MFHRRLFFSEQPGYSITGYHGISSDEPGKQL